MPFYKYVSAERGIEILRKRMLRFTQPGAFNDPFECKPFIQSLSDGIDQKTKFPSFNVKAESAVWWAEVKSRLREFPLSPKQEQRLLRGFEKGLQDLCGKPLKHMMDEAGSIDLFRKVLPTGFDVSIGILSLAEEPDNHLMWSHYSVDHTGLVIGFDETHSYFSPSSAGAKNMGPFVFKKVHYSIDRDRPSINSFEDFQQSDLYFTKSAGWRYENEWRMIRSLRFATKVLEENEHSKCPKCGAGKCEYVIRNRSMRRSHDMTFVTEILRHRPEKYIYLFSIPPRAIKSIIFGCKISLADERKIKRILDRSKHYSHVRKYRAQLDEKAFKLNIIRWKPRPSSRVV